MQDIIVILQRSFKEIKVSFSRIPNQRKILGVAGILLAGFLLYQSLIEIHLLRLKAANLQFISQKKLIDCYKRLIKNSGVFINEAREEEKTFNQVKEGFVDEGQLPDYFTNFRNLSKSYNLQVLALEFMPQEAIAGTGQKPLAYYQKLPFVLSLKGNYFNAMSLLYKLEEGKPIFDIDSIRIRQESPDSYDVLVDINASIYIILMEKTRYESY